MIVLCVVVDPLTLVLLLFVCFLLSCVFCAASLLFLYSRKLQAAETIREIIVWEQGKGIVNNLGALRIKKLAEWGIYNDKTHIVYNWDLKTPSPVIHQWDRDEALHTWLYRNKMQAYVREWKTGTYQQRQDAQKQA